MSSFILTLSISLMAIYFAFILLFRADYILLLSTTSTFFWPFVYLLDTISYLWLCISLLIYYVSNKLQVSTFTYFYSDVNSKIAFNATSNSYVAAKDLHSLPSLISKNSVDNNWLQLIRVLYRSVSLVSQTSSLSRFDKSYAINNTGVSTQLFFNSIGSKNISSSYISDYSFSLNTATSNTLSSYLKNVVLSNKVTLASLSTNNSRLSNSYNSAITENLSLSNQIRWYHKTSPITEKLASDNFNFTQAKNLLGSPLTNSLASSNNIWFSNNMNALKNSSSFALQDSISNLNYFEDGRFWLMKKFYIASSNLYTLSYSTSNQANDTKVYQSIDPLLSAHLLDYSLSSSNIRLNLHSPSTAENFTKLTNIYTPDTTVYQDSLNSYLLSLSTTTLVGNFNNFSHNQIITNKFSFNK